MYVFVDFDLISDLFLASLGHQQPWYWLCSLNGIITLHKGRLQQTVTSYSRRMTDNIGCLMEYILQERVKLHNLRNIPCHYVKCYFTCRKTVSLSFHILMMTSSNGNYFPRVWTFVRGIHRGPVNSPHKGHRRGAWMFSLICARIHAWVNNREASYCSWVSNN